MSILIWGFLISACSNGEIPEISYWYQETETNDNSLVRKAKSMVNSLEGHISPLDMSKTIGKTHTRSFESNSMALKDGGFMLDWDAACTYYENDGDVLVIPMRMRQNVAMWRHSVVNNKCKTEQTPIHSFLSIKYLKGTERMVCRVFSYAPSRSFLKENENRFDVSWYDPMHTDYSGLFLVSTLDGTLQYGVNFEKGHRQFSFRPNLKNNVATRTVSDTCQHVHCEHETENVVHKTIFSMRTVTSESAISTYSTSNEDYEIPGCVFCGGDPFNCDCLIIEEEPCIICGYNPCECSYCIDCNQDLCICEYCPFCGFKKIYCTCNQNSNNTGGSTGGSSNNNNNNNSSNNSGSNNNSSSNNNTSSPTTFSPGRITEVAQNSVATVISKFGTEKAYCNQGVIHAFNALFSTKELDGMNANRMTQYWLDHPDSWEKISMDEAQNYANDGYFTVAGFINPTGHSGHVVVIVPGVPEYSTSWGTNVPWTMDTGHNMRESKQKLSQSFSSKKKDSIHYFIYKK